MKKLTAAEFKSEIEADPSWASKLTEPVEIAEPCSFVGGPITHLSPLLHFTGRDEGGASAIFLRCKKLKIAEGHFRYAVIFHASSIETIGHLEAGFQDRETSASFTACRNLKVATGTYPGSVVFSGSGIEKIEHLVAGPGHDETSGFFHGCKNLKVAEGTFHGCASFQGSGIEKIGNLTIIRGRFRDGKKADFRDCPRLKRLHKWVHEPIFADEEVIRREKAFYSM